MNSTRATVFASVLLLLFIQTLTVWIESIYKIGLTRLSLGAEAAALLFVFSPLLLLVWPERRQQALRWGSLFLFLVARALLPLASVRTGALLGGVGVGAFLVLLCLALSGPYRYLQGNAGMALGLALLMSIALRAWGATCDFTLGSAGAPPGWLLTVAALLLFCGLRPDDCSGASRRALPGRHGPGPALGLLANLAVVYLVLSSPGVVEAWLGFDNTVGTMLCVGALGIALILLRRGVFVSRAMLVVWNLLFGIALVGGILALRVTFPATPESPALLVRPENTRAWVLLNLMFLLSPVVVFNVHAARRSLGESGNSRRLAVPVFLGMTFLVLVTLASIFTNVWGYVGPVSAVFRNQFHVPFLVTAIVMAGSFFLPGWRFEAGQSEPSSSSRFLMGATVAVVVAGLAGAWHYRPVKNQPGAHPKQLTILTYNLQQGAALKGDRNWERQLALLKVINADLVGLQESDTARPSNGNVSAPEYFGARLGYHVYYGPNTVSGTYGTAILSRFPLKNPRTFFTFSDQDEVGTAVAEVEVDGKTFAFFNSHPSGAIPRRCHAKELVRHATPYQYVIAVGDYNTSPGEEPYRIIMSQLKDSWLERHPEGVGALHPVLRPRELIRPHGSSGQIAASGDTLAVPDRIDHIFLSKPLHVLESFYLPAPASETDHPAHWAVVTWD